MIDDGKFEVFSLLDLDELFRDCFGIPLAAEKEGPHAYTLGAYERACGKNGNTFASQEKIAQLAYLPPKTLEKHLRKNIDNGWLENHGRRKRRTATVSLSKRFKAEMKLGRRLHPRIFDERLTWPMRVILAYVTNQTIAPQAQLPERIGEWCEPLVRRYSTISTNTGLSLPTTRKAIRELKHLSYLAIEPLDGGAIEISLEDTQVKRIKPSIFRKSEATVLRQTIRPRRRRAVEKQGSEPEKIDEPPENTGGSTYLLLLNHYLSNHYLPSLVEDQDYLLDINEIDWAWTYDRVSKEL